MPRTYSKKITKEELAQLMVDSVKNQSHEAEEAFLEELVELGDKIKSPFDIFEKSYHFQALITTVSDDVEKDLYKVQFDWENFEFDDKSSNVNDNTLLGFHTINDLTFLGCYAGGDWEHPVFFIIYYDGKKLRAYIPTDGNPWNTDTKSAYGNHKDEIDYDVDYLKIAAFGRDTINFRKRYSDLKINSADDILSLAKFEYDKIEKDILKRIVFTGNSEAEDKPKKKKDNGIEKIVDNVCDCDEWFEQGNRDEFIRVGNNLLNKDLSLEDIKDVMQSLYKATANEVK